MHTVLMLVNIGGKEENVASLVQHASNTCDDHSAIRKSSSQSIAFLFSLSLTSFSISFFTLHVLKHSLYCITDMAVHRGFFIDSCYFGCRQRE